MLMWQVSAEGWDKPIVDRLNAVLQRIWDEMTRLPWSDEEIAIALSAALAIFFTAETLHQSQGLDGRALERETLRRVLARPLRVELGGRGNIHTWAWVDEGELMAAVRPDFESLLVQRAVIESWAILLIRSWSRARRRCSSTSGGCLRCLQGR